MIKKIVLIILVPLFLSIFFWPRQYVPNSYVSQLVYMASRSHKEAYTINKTISYYFLSLSWPNSFCKNKSCESPITQTFTIHGLWPQFQKTPVPSYSRYLQCTNVKPTSSCLLGHRLKDAQLQTDLVEFWPDLRNYSNYESNLLFWCHEWDKHGKDSAYPDDPEKYFQLTLNLIKKYNLRKILNDYGIVPRSMPYPLKEIRAAVQKKIGAYPQVNCKNVDETVLLMELRLCLNGTDLDQFIDCPKNVSGDCKELDENVTFTPPRG